MALTDIRDHPGDEMIDAIRARFPTESEIDRVLTRKMRRRGTPFVFTALDKLAATTADLIADRLGYDIEIVDPAWLSGGASKIQMRFDLRWRGHGGRGDADVLTPMVLRMEPAASTTESSRRREYEVLEAVKGVIPSPTPYWVDADAEFLPYPAMIYDFMRGVAKPSHDSDKVSGLGQNYGPELRAKLAPQFVEMLARLHMLDAAKLVGLDHFERPVAGSNASVFKQLNASRRIWEEDRIEDEPLMEVVFGWLVANAPPLDHVSIVHNDYRSGNFLFDEASGRITAWLDWEGAVLGDRHQDLTYATLPIFQHLSEDCEKVLASGMLEVDDFYAAYGRVSTLPVDPKRLRFYGVYNRYHVTVLLLGAAARAARAAASHQDVLLNHVSALGYIALAELREFFVAAAR